MSDEALVGAKLQALLDNTELADVIFVELSAARLDVQADPPVETNGALSVSVGQPDDNTQVLVRVATELVSHQASFRAAVAGVYKLAEPTLVDDDTRRAFADSGPLLTLIPFLREGLMSSALRLRVDVPMVPLIRVQLPVAETKELDPRRNSDAIEAGSG